MPHSSNRPRRHDYAGTDEFIEALILNLEISIMQNLDALTAKVDTLTALCQQASDFIATVPQKITDAVAAQAAGDDAALAALTSKVSADVTQLTAALPAATPVPTPAPTDAPAPTTAPADTTAGAAGADTVAGAPAA